MGMCPPYLFIFMMKLQKGISPDKPLATPISIHTYMLNVFIFTILLILNFITSKKIVTIYEGDPQNGRNYSAEPGVTPEHS